MKNGETQIPEANGESKGYNDSTLIQFDILLTNIDYSRQYNVIKYISKYTFLITVILKFFFSSKYAFLKWGWGVSSVD